MQALNLAIQMSYVMITSSSLLGLPVTNVSVFLPAAIIHEWALICSRRRTRGMGAKEDAKRNGGCVGDFCSCHCVSVCPGRLST